MMRLYAYHNEYYKWIFMLADAEERTRMVRALDWEAGRDDRGSDDDGGRDSDDDDDDSDSDYTPESEAFMIEVLRGVL